MKPKSAVIPRITRSRAVDGIGPLQRQQRALVEMVEADLVGQELAQVADIVPLGRAVDDEVIGRFAPVPLGAGLVVARDPAG